MRVNSGAARERLRVASLRLRSDGNWGEKDGVWSDSPQGNYSNRADWSLETGPISLEGLRDGRLDFRTQFELEKGYDRLLVEARDLDGGSWKTLESYTGSSDWSEQSVKLKGFSGEEIQLRFRLTSDGSGTADGASVSQIRVSGKPGLMGGHQEVFSGDEPHPFADRLATMSDAEVRRLDRLATVSSLDTALDLESQVNPRSEAEIATLEQLYREFKGEAPELYRLLDPGQSRQNLPQRRTALIGLVKKLGSEQASKLWPRIEASQNPDVDFQSRLAAAASLIDYRQAEKVYSDLQSQSYSHGQLRDVEWIAEQLRHWSPSGQWGPEAGGWSDSPGSRYSSSANDSLTSRSLVLEGESAQVSFEFQHQLEKGYDHVHLEESRDGGAWTELESYSGDSASTKTSMKLKGGAQEVQLRFRLTSDGSGQEDGFLFRDFELRSGGRDLISGQTPHPLSGEVSTLLGQGADPIKFANLARSGGLKSALRLWPGISNQDQHQLLEQLIAENREFENAEHLWLALKDHLGQADFEQRRNALQELADEVGAQRASELQGMLDQGFAADYDTQVEVFGLARDLHHLSNGSPEELYLELARSGLSAAGRQGLAELATRTTVWEAQGEWAPIEGGWDDSPNERMPNYATGTLTSEPIDLTEWRSPLFSFEARFNLEKGYDKIHLEASKDGESWETLESFTGEVTEWTRFEAKIPGGTPMLRFRQQSDSSTRSEGFQVRDFQVAGKKAWYHWSRQPSFRVGKPSQVEETVLKMLLDPSTPAATREQRLELCLELLATELEPETALELALEFEDPSVLRNKASGIAQVTQVLGAERAAQAIREKSLAGASSEAMLVELESRYESVRAELSPENRAALSSLRLSPESMETFLRLTDQVGQRPWETEGSWSVGDQGGWATNGYQNGVEQSVTSPALDLSEVGGAQARFKADWDLEKGYDYVHFEASKDGRNWETLETFTGFPSGEEHRFSLRKFKGKKHPGQISSYQRQQWYPGRVRLSFF